MKDQDAGPDHASSTWVEWKPVSWKSIRVGAGRWVIPWAWASGVMRGESMRCTGLPSPPAQTHLDQPAWKKGHSQQRRASEAHRR